MIRLDSIILLAIPWIIYRVVVLAIHNQFSLKNEWNKGLFYFSVVFIYSLTLFPFPLNVYSHMESGAAYQLVNLTPFATINSQLTHSNEMVAFRNIVGNILLFMPLGFSIPQRFNINKFWAIVFLGFFTSLLVEVMQIFTFIRSFDVDDLMLNTLGASIGFVLYRLFNKAGHSRNNPYKKEPRATSR
ncbi:VanZ family protein [Paenibacillus sp. N1-5-1-14]|uniref:VanZ family protein n=1 Tax=Paenibacillus radicibacter TaxID=2972488 RepID=UPI0021593547|nr:VanZ family protein [Paenibacillus radicibacter]MCR8642879.1 VanZ family protein [Paenibacillus radicibacter]